jgi:hypothetical protein
VPPAALVLLPPTPPEPLLDVLPDPAVAPPAPSVPEPDPLVALPLDPGPLPVVAPVAPVVVVPAVRCPPDEPGSSDTPLQARPNANSETAEMMEDFMESSLLSPADVWFRRASDTIRLSHLLYEYDSEKSIARAVLVVIKAICPNTCRQSAEFHAVVGVDGRSTLPADWPRLSG